ncbi:MAG: sugar kinase [Promethearchaeota archaeon]
MCPDIISLGELLVEIMRPELDTPHGTIGAIYRGPFPSGAPANFISTAARMGKPFGFTTGFIGVIGDDEFGKLITEKLKADNVDISQIKISKDKHTGIAFNQYNSDGSRRFIFAAGAASQTSIENINSEYFSDIKNLHIMGSALSISKSSRDSCNKAIKLAKLINPDVVISFDPNLRPEMMRLKNILEICQPVLEVTDILLPSGQEVEMLAGIANSKKACQKFLKKGIKIIVLKQGNKGCTVFTLDKKEGLKCKAFKVKEIDPTGAGDSFGGAFVIGYLAGWNLGKIATFANAVGALKVSSFFGPMPDTSYDEVIDFIKTN